MKKILFCLTLLAVIFTVSAAFATDGVVNPDAVFASYPKFAQAQKQLAALAQQKDAEIRAEKDENKRRQLRQQAAQQIAAEEQRLMGPVLKEVHDAIAKVAKAKKLIMVHNMGTVYYGGVDITKDVIAALK